MKEKRSLIYPVSFVTFGRDVERSGFYDPESGMAPDYSVSGIFKGIDVRTKEEIEKHTSQYFSDFSLSSGSDEYLSGNDILFMEFSPFIGYSINEDKPSFEEVSTFYDLLKSEGVSEEKISDIVLNHFESNNSKRR